MLLGFAKRKLNGLRRIKTTVLQAISNGNRTEWSPIRSVIIRVISKSDDRAARVPFVNHGMITDRVGRHEVLIPINHKNYNFREKNSQVMKERENSPWNTCKGDVNILRPSDLPPAIRHQAALNVIGLLNCPTGKWISATGKIGVIF